MALTGVPTMYVQKCQLRSHRLFYLLVCLKQGLLTGSKLKVYVASHDLPYESGGSKMGKPLWVKHTLDVPKCTAFRAC